MIKANRNLNKLTPRFKQKVEFFLKEATNIFITEGWRSKSRQQELYNQWRTTPWKIVTWTLKSNHLKWEAIDVAFKWKELYPSDRVLWNKVFDTAKKYGIDSLYVKHWVDSPHLQDNWKELIKSSYNDVKVKIGSEMPEQYNAYYNPKNKTIYVQYLYFKNQRWENVLFHEYCHYVFIEKIPKIYQNLWNKLYSFNPTIIKKLNKFLKTNFIENDFISEYAKTNYLEWFAECMEQNFLISKWVDKKVYKWFLKVKLYIAKLLFNKFVNEQYKLK